MTSTPARHNDHNLLCAVGLLFPVVGVLVGVYGLTRESAAWRATARAVMGWSLAGVGLSLAISAVIIAAEFAILPKILEDTETTTATSASIRVSDLTTQWDTSDMTQGMQMIVYGRYTNTGTRDTSPTLKAVAFDGSGKIIATEESLQTAVGPGEAKTFDIRLDIPAGVRVANYTVEVSSAITY